jgi:CRISPR-associated endonuclease Csy4
MRHYIDIRLRPDPEFVETQLMNALFSKLHRAFVLLKNEEIGISFPDFAPKRPLGQRLRLHGSYDSLERLRSLNWLVGMHDHVTVTDTLETPTLSQYRTVRRVQVDSNPERLRRRYLKRHPEKTEAEVTELYHEYEKRTDLPFVSVRSQSTGQPFRLFINHGELLDSTQAGNFNCYGLSPTATIPWF